MYQVLRIVKRHKEKVSDRTYDLLTPHLSPTGLHDVFCARRLYFLPCGRLISGVRIKLERNAELRAAFQQAEQDKRDVTVLPGDTATDFGVVELAGAQRGVRISLVVRTTDPSSRTSILQANVTTISPNAPCPFVATITGGGRRLMFVRDINVDVTFRHGNFGRYEGRLEMIFQDRSTKQFIIVRHLRAVVGDPADHQALKVKVPYTGRQHVPWKLGRRLVPGRRPPNIDAIPWKTKLALAPIPAAVVEALKTKATNEEIAQYIRTRILPRSFDATTHGQRFKILLWMEEYRMNKDLRMADAELKKKGSLYHLAVPGLAEKRPSVLVGDRFEVQSSAFDSHECFEGWVHAIEMETVGLAFHTSFKPSADQRFNVRFKLNRVPLQRQHEALSATPPSLPRLLFPTPTHAGLAAVPSTAVVPLVLFNQLLASNVEQMQAVRSIRRMTPGCAPFIVFGPPGTGKTVTIVESIRQTLLANPNAHILACAPSNSAADILAQRLMMLGKDKLFRFYAVSRTPNLVLPELLPFTFVNAQGYFSLPDMQRLSRFNVIVATCGSASFPHGIGMPAGHFSHIFIDEAGQATEAEVMLAMKTIITASTNVVLSGDPQQLGPIVRSAVARELGFGKSYLERLMEREIYNLQRYCGRTIVKLVKNFRSHNAILSFPNERFYDGELETRGNPAIINSFLNSAVLANRKFPVVFHAISGKDDRERTSPSYFNIDEITLGKEYVQRLLNDKHYKIADEDIGIIAPYNAHVRKVRNALRTIAPHTKVGSVEEFQGQERRVIIVSTVRSSRELMNYDAKYTLGFVSNPRRFNVAMTRAQALLIVIGDPSVLSIDPLWRAFLNYVHIHGGWKGDPISWDPHAPVHDGAYDSELRDMGEAEAAAFMQRIQSFSGADDDTEQDRAEGEANFERVFTEVE